MTILLLWLAGCDGPADPPAAPVDGDSDGWAADVDCDDADASVHPGAPDAWYDGLDADCAGNDDFDQDADGAPLAGDCDDADPLAAPGLPEVFYDGRDGDCAGGSDWDADADGWSAPGAPEGTPTDCDDADPLVNPGVVKNDPLVRLGVPGDVAPTALTYGSSDVFAISGESDKDQHHATVSFGPDGRFLAAWQSGDIGFAPGAVTRLFDGIAPVNAGGLVQDPGEAAAKPDVESWPGGYVVAWEEGSLNRVLIRGFDLDGAPVTAPIVVWEGNTIEAPDLALNPDGSGAVVWVETGGTSGEGEHALRRFGPDLQPVGDRVLVEAAGWTVAEIAPRTDGGLVMVATRKLPELADHLEVYGRVIAGDGCETNFRADQAESTGPSRPTLDVDDDDRFAVTWRSKVEVGVGEGAYGRFFEADGTARSDSFLLSVPGEEANRSVVAYAGDHVVFGWEGHPDPADLEAPEAVYVWTWDGVAMTPASARIAVSEEGALSAERPAISVLEHADGTADLVTTWENVGPEVRVVGRILGLAP